jgi:hypothetical protein
MLIRWGALAAFGAMVGLSSGCAALGAALLKPSPCMSAHPRPGEWTAAELSASGVAELESAVAATSAGPAERAAACFLRARQLSADDYGANLGLGVSYLVQAKVASQKGDKDKTRRLLGEAKRALGIAYFIGQGQLEPVYYLAEVAALEGGADVGLAESLLLYLDKAGYKRGPVYVLLGYLSEHSGNKEKARSYYTAALQQNWPYASASYAEQRLHDGGK